MSDQDSFYTEFGNKILSKSDSGKRIILSEKVNNFKNSGFSAESVVEILTANDNNDLNLIESVVDSVYNRVSSAKIKGNRQAYVCPTSYSEIKFNIENDLMKSGPTDFINKLSRTKNPIMPVNDKAYNSYLRLASDAHKTKKFDNLHNGLKKWFEEAIYVSVCAARSNKNDIRIASVNGKYVATNNRNASCEVCLESGTCNCSKFIDGNYSDYGLACEHIVAAADVSSPHQRLLKAIKDVDIESKEDNYIFDLRAVNRS